VSRASIGLMATISVLFIAGCGGGNSSPDQAARTWSVTVANNVGGPEQVAEAVALAKAGRKRPAVHADGTVTPGVSETLRIAHLPPGRAFEVVLGPVGAENGCRDSGVVCAIRVFPPSGASPFRSSAKGRATARFLVPSGYHKAQEPQGTPLGDYPFSDGQRIVIAVSSFGQGARHQLAISSARTRATVVLVG
jgi:hypothetical protein